MTVVAKRGFQLTGYVGSTVFPWASFSTSAKARYTALAPQMTPSIPIMRVNGSKFVVVNDVYDSIADLIASKKNSTAKLMKTNCIARLAFRVPKNMTKVNSPHMKK